MCSQCQHGPVTTPKAAYHHGDLRNALVTAALEMVEAGDVESFSLREVARRVGVSANATYRHFDDKASLLVAVTRAGFELMAESMRSSLRDASQPTKLAGKLADTESRSAAHKSTSKRTRPRPTHEASPAAATRLRAVGRAYVEFALARPALFRAMFGPYGVRALVPRGGDEATLDTATSPFQLLVAALGDLVDDGLLPREDAHDATFHAWVVVHGCATLVLEGAVQLGDATTREARIKGLLDFAIRGLVTTPGAAEGASTRHTSRSSRPTALSSRSAKSR